jgi:acetate kinase
MARLGRAGLGRVTLNKQKEGDNMFETKNEKPLWQMAYDEIKDKETGAIITYEELTEYLGQEASKSRFAIYSLMKHMLKEQKRTLESVRNIGYRIIEGMKIMLKAENHDEKGEKQVKTAVTLLKNINTVNLTAEERLKLQNFMSYNANIRAAFTQTIEKIEKATQVTQIAQSFTADQIAKLKALISI